MMGRDFTAADNAGRREGRAHRLRHLAARLRRRGRHRGQGRPHQRQARHHHRRDAARVRLPHQRGAVDPALQRVPGAAAERSARHQPRRPGRAAARRLPRPGQRGDRRPSPSASPPPTPTPTSRSTPAQVQPLIETFTPRPLRGTLLTMLGFCVGVLLIACVNVMNMQFARATLRAKELAVRSSLGATRARLVRQMLTESLLLAVIGAALGIGLAAVSVDWLSAVIRNLPTPPPAWITLRHRRPRARLHGGGHARGGGRLGPAAGLDVVARGRGGRAQGGRPRQHQPQRRARDARPGRVPDRRDLHPADRIAAAGAVDRQPADHRLRLRHRGPHVGPHGADGRRLSDAGRAPAVLRPRCCASCAATLPSRRSP